MQFASSWLIEGLYLLSCSRSTNHLILLVTMPSFTAQVLKAMAGFLLSNLLVCLPNMGAMLQFFLHQTLNLLKRFVYEREIYVYFLFIGSEFKMVLVRKQEGIWTNCKMFNMLRCLLFLTFLVSTFKVYLDFINLELICSHVNVCGILYTFVITVNFIMVSKQFQEPCLVFPHFVHLSNSLCFRLFIVFICCYSVHKMRGLTPASKAQCRIR